MPESQQSNLISEKLTTALFCRIVALVSIMGQDESSLWNKERRERERLKQREKDEWEEQVNHSRTFFKCLCRRELPGGAKRTLWEQGCVKMVGEPRPPGGATCSQGEYEFHLQAASSPEVGGVLQKQASTPRKRVGYKLHPAQGIPCLQKCQVNPLSYENTTSDLGRGVCMWRGWASKVKSKEGKLSMPACPTA